MSHLRASKMKSAQGAADKSASLEYPPEALPFLKIKNKLNQIHIPQVIKSVVDNSPRSGNDADSINTGDGSSVTAGSAGRGKLERQGSGMLGSPVKKLDPRTLAIDVFDVHDKGPNTKLDILEGYLPRSLRGQYRAKTREVENAMHEEERAVLAELLGKSNINLEQRYIPKHLSSGAASVMGPYNGSEEDDDDYDSDNEDESSIPKRPLSGMPKRKSSMSSSLPMLRPSPGHTLRSHSGNKRTGSNNKSSSSINKSHRHQNTAGGGMWATKETPTMEKREIVSKMDYISEELKKGIDHYKAEELRKEQEELAIVLKMKTLNTLFNKKITFADSLKARAKLTEGHLDHDTDVMLLDKHRYTKGLKDDDALQFRSIKKSGDGGDNDAQEDNDGKLTEAEIVAILRAREKKQRAKELYGSDAEHSKDFTEADKMIKQVSIGKISREASKKDVNSSDGSESRGETRKAPPSSATSSTAKDLSSGPAPSSSSVPSSSSSSSSAAVAAAAGGQPPSNSKGSKWGVVTALMDVHKEEKISEVEKKMQEKLQISSSKVRDKLRNLGAFINSHTNRKLLDNWNMIELRFKNSQHKKTVYKTNEKGMTYPVNQQAIYAATLTHMLCSTKVKVGYRELITMFEKFGMTAEQALYARKVAALQNLIALDADGMGDPKRTREFKMSLQALLKQEDVLISLEDMIEEAFPEDPIEREFEFKRIHARKHSEAEANLKEAEKRKAAKEAAEQKRTRLIRDFETALGEAQILKGGVDYDRFDNFANLIKKCTNNLQKYRDEKSLKIPADVVSFLGIEVFPDIIQKKIQAKTAAMRASMDKAKAKSDASRASASVASSKATLNKADNSSNVVDVVDAAAAAAAGPTSPSGSVSSQQSNYAKRKTEAAKLKTPAGSTVGGTSGGGGTGGGGGGGGGGTGGGGGGDNESLMSGFDDDSSIISLEDSQSLDPHEEVLLHIIKPGDTMKKICSRYMLYPKEIASANGLPSLDQIPYVGNELIIPGAGKGLIRGWAARKVKLGGPPRVINLFRETVTFGRGLCGEPYREVVGMMQFIAAQRIQSLFRRVSRLWRYKAAAAKWRAIDFNILKSHYGGWLYITVHNVDTRRYCYRKLVAWNFYTHRAKRRRNIFRQCFWLFRTWRKVSDASATAKEKARFLVNRVMPTVLTIKVFKAWKGYSVAQIALNKKSKKFFRSLELKKLQQAVDWLHDWARRRRHIRKSWVRKGERLRRLATKARKFTPFMIWKAWMEYRKTARARLSCGALSHGFRHKLLNNRLPVHTRSNTERRLDITAGGGSLFRPAAVSIIQGGNSTANSRGGSKATSPRGAIEGKSGAKASRKGSVVATPKAGRRASVSSAAKKGAEVGSGSDTSAAPQTTVDNSDGDGKLTPSSRRASRKQGGGVAMRSRPSSQPSEGESDDDGFVPPHNRNFKWKARLQELWDIDSDGEDAEDLPDAIKVRFEQLLEFGVERRQELELHALKKQAEEETRKHAAKLEAEKQQLLKAEAEALGFSLDANGGSSVLSVTSHDAAAGTVAVAPSERVSKKAKAKAAHQQKLLALKKQLEDEHARLTPQSFYDEDALRLLPFPTPSDSHSNLSFLQNIIDNELDNTVISCVDSLRRGFSLRDQWNIFEGACRFHRMAFRAFTNLRVHACFRRRSKRFRARHLMATKKLCFGVLRHMMVEGTRRLNPVNEAEKIVGAHREHVMTVHTRNRKLGSDVKAIFGDEDSDGLSDDETTAGIMKNLNLLDADASDEAVEQERLDAEARRAAIKQKQANDEAARLASRGGWKVPDLYEWDKGDRELESALADRMVVFSQDVTEQTTALIATVDLESAAFVKRAGKMETLVEEVLTIESGVTSSAVVLHDEYVSKFKEHAASKLLDTLTKVYLEVQLSLLKEESKLYFRALRMPFVIARSKHMLNRKKLMNWIRTCNRLIAISRRAPFYQKRRTQWVTFNRWIKFLEIQHLNASPGWVEKVKRRCKLHPDLNESLKDMGYGDGAKDNMSSKMSEFSLIYKRWKMYTQEQILFRELERIVAAIHRLTSLQRCFIGLKTKLHAQTIYEMIRNGPKLFTLVRLYADLEAITKRFVAARKQSVTFTAQKLNRQIVQFNKKEGKTAMSFKKFLVQLEGDIKSRIATEQRILSESFEKRGTMEAVDVHTPLRSHPIMPQIMATLEGKRFADPEYIAPPLLPGQKKKEEDEASESRAGTPDQFADNGRIRSNSPSRPVSGSHIMPSSEAGKTKKKVVVEEAVKYDSYDSSVPPGYKISKVRLAMQDALGLIGWQIIYAADGCKDIDSPKRGMWHAASMSIQEIYVPKEEFVIGVEYLYDGMTIVGLRLKLFFSGFTRWVGGRNNLSTLSVYMGASELAVDDEKDVNRNKYSLENENADPALPVKHVIGFTGLLIKGRSTCLGLVVRKVYDQNIFSYFWVKDALDKLKAERKKVEATLKDEAEKAQKAVEEAAQLADLRAQTEAAEQRLAQIQEETRKYANGEGDDEDYDDEENSMFDDDSSLDDNSTLMSQEGTLDGGDAAAGGAAAAGGTAGKGTEASKRSKKSLGTSITSNSSRGSTVTMSTRHRRRKERLAKKRRAAIVASAAAPDADMVLSSVVTGGGNVLAGDQEASPLMPSEIQFFDVLRMRSTELSNALQRVNEFARRLWTSREIRDDPRLSKLVNIKLVSRLANWMFNGISRHLIHLSATEKEGLHLLKMARRGTNKADANMKRSVAAIITAQTMEEGVYSWTGKSMLGPQERARKKLHTKQLADLKSDGERLQKEAEELRIKAAEDEKVGKALLPRIPLTNDIYKNYKLKIAAARHKESLMERMTMEELKTGLFGSNDGKSDLLNKDQMQAIHQSLKNQKITLKDTTSLSRLVEDVLEEEQALIDEEHSRKEAAAAKLAAEARAAGSKLSNARLRAAAAVIAAQQLGQNSSLSMGSSAVSQVGPGTLSRGVSRGTGNLGAMSGANSRRDINSLGSGGKSSRGNGNSGPGSRGNLSFDIDGSFSSDPNLNMIAANVDLEDLSPEKALAVGFTDGVSGGGSEYGSIVSAITNGTETRKKSNSTSGGGGKNIAATPPPRHLSKSGGGMAVNIPGVGKKGGTVTGTTTSPQHRQQFTDEDG